MYNFEKLEVWQVAVEFADDVYRNTSSFPSAERFGLTSQLRRASVSVSSNIAEGAGRHYKQDHIRFLRMALGSVYETVTQFFIAKNENYLKNENFKDLYKKSERISKMIYRLIEALNEPTAKSSDIGHRKANTSSDFGHRITKEYHEKT